MAGALRQAGATVQIHDDHFPPNAKDEDWIPVVANHGWVILTKDKRIRYRVPEKVALIQSRARAFVLTSKNLRGEEMGEAFVKALPRMKRLLAATPGPLIASVTRQGAVSIIYPENAS